jgi:hypothetical protein
LSKKWYKIVKKLSKSCGKVVEKLQKVDKKLSKQLSKSCQKVQNSTNSGGVWGVGWGNNSSKAKN